MAICANCKHEETQLYEDGVPICIPCANAEQEAKLDGIEKAYAVAAGGDGHYDGRFGQIPECLR